MMPAPEYRLVRRYKSNVAHAVRPGSNVSLCYQWTNSRFAVAVEIKPGQVPMCKRCARRLEQLQADSP